MTRYTDEYLEHWGEVFTQRNLHRDAPDAAPLLPEQEAVLTRLTLAEMEGDSLTDALTEALMPDTAKVCGGRVVEPLKHHSHKHNPVPKEVRHASR